MPSVTVLLVLLVSAATFTGVVFYSQPNVPDPQLLVPLGGRITPNVQIDGVTRLCTAGDELCKVTGSSDATPADADQIVLLRDLPGVPNGKEVAKLRTGCGLTNQVNGNGEIVINTAIEAGPGIAITPGCGDGDPVVISSDASGITPDLNVSYISDNFLTDKCGFAHAYNGMTNAIEAGILIEGVDGILVGPCPDGGAQQLGLNSTAIVENLDINAFHDAYVKPLCGLASAVVGNAIELSLEIVGEDGVLVGLPCADDDPLVIGLNGTAVTASLDVDYISTSILTDGCGIAHTLTGPTDALQIEFNADIAAGSGIALSGCSPITIAVDGNDLFTNQFADGCGVDTVYVSGTIRDRLNLANTDGYVVFDPCSDGAPRTINLAQLNTSIGGTGFDTASTGVLLYGNAGAWDLRAPGNPDDVLTMAGGVPAWLAPSFVTDVTATAPLSSSGGLTPDISLSGTIPAANGGTGLGAPALGAMLYGDGTQWLFLPPGMAGDILSISGGVPTWSASAPGGPIVPTGTFTVFVDNDLGSDTNDGLTIGTAVQTLTQAITILNQNAAATGIISLGTGDMFALGADPVLSFFPASGNYERILIAGGRSAVVSGTVTSYSSDHGPTNKWHTLTVTGGPLIVNNYARAFIQNTRTGIVFSVFSNTAGTVRIVGGDTTVTDLTRTVPFENGDPYTIFTISTTLTWTGDLTVRQPSNLLWVTDLIVNGGAGNTWVNPSVRPLTVVFSGCTIIASTVGGAPTISGSVRFQGVSVDGVGATTNDVFVVASRPPDLSILSSVYARWAAFKLSDNDVLIDLYGEQLSNGVQVVGSETSIQGIDLLNTNDEVGVQTTTSTAGIMNDIRIRWTAIPNYHVVNSNKAVRGLSIRQASAFSITDLEISLVLGGAYERSQFASVIGLDVDTNSDATVFGTLVINLANRGSGAIGGDGVGRAVRANNGGSIFINGPSTLTAAGSILHAFESTIVFKLRDDSFASSWTIPPDPSPESDTNRGIRVVNAFENSQISVILSTSQNLNINMGSNTGGFPTIFFTSRRSDLTIVNPGSLVYASIGAGTTTLSNGVSPNIAYPGAVATLSDYGEMSPEFCITYVFGA